MLFADQVSLECPRGMRVLRGTFSADIVDDGTMMPFDTTIAQTQIREITAFFRHDKWRQFGVTMPVIGDRIALANGEKYAIFAVTDIGRNVFSARARKC